MMTFRYDLPPRTLPSASSRDRHACSDSTVAIEYPAHIVSSVPARCASVVSSAGLHPGGYLKCSRCVTTTENEQKPA
jgi:hypothetical protein